jgi:hypothetical protein
VGACRGRPRFSSSAASLFGNVVVEVGRSLVLLREPWIVAVSTCRKVLYLLASPRCARRQWFSCLNGIGGQGGSGASAVCGYRHLKEGRQGVRPGSGLGATSDNGERDDLGCDEQRDYGVARTPGRREGHVCGDGVHWRLLEAVLLPARRRGERDAGQPARRPQSAGPENRRPRCCVAGRPGRARAVAGLAGPAATDPAVT